MNTFRQTLAAALAFLVMFALPGCRAPKPSPIPDRPTAAVSERLGPGDTLKITFLGNREFDQVQRIRSDGKVSLPTIGEYKAAGKTLASAQGELSGLYKKQLQNAEVMVSLEGTAAAIYVVGAVGRAGKIPFDRPMTALDAIMEAGGFTPGLANPKKVTLIRNVDGKQQTRVLDLSPVLKGETTQAFYLKPYDTLQVAERFF